MWCLTYQLSQSIDYIAYHALGLTLEQVELAYQGKQLSLPVVAADEFDIVRHDLPFTLEESAELTIRFTGLVGEVLHRIRAGRLRRIRRCKRQDGT